MFRYHSLSLSLSLSVSITHTDTHMCTHTNKRTLSFGYRMPNINPIGKNHNKLIDIDSVYTSVKKVDISTVYTNTQVKTVDISPVYI